MLKLKLRPRGPLDPESPGATRPRIISVACHAMGTRSSRHLAGARLEKDSKYLYPFLGDQVLEKARKELPSVPFRWFFSCRSPPGGAPGG